MILPVTIPRLMSKILSSLERCYKKAVDDKNNVISDNDYISDSPEPDETNSNQLAMMNEQLILQESWDMDEEEDTGNHLSSSSSCVSNHSDEEIINDLKQNNLPVIPKVSDEDLKTIQVLGKLKKLHNNIEKCDECTALTEMDRGMVFKDSTDELAQYNNMIVTRLEYKKKWGIPQTLFTNQLLEKARKYFALIDEILGGVRPSIYYDNARKAFKKSSRGTLSVQEFRGLDLKLFTAGYFGIKRQIRLGTDILDEYKDVLLKHRNPTVQWWGPTDFSYYVLAPEMLAYVCKEELCLTDIEDAWSFLENTTEYGLVVADEEPMEYWEIEFEKQKLQRLSSKYTNIEQNEE